MTILVLDPLSSGSTYLFRLHAAGVDFEVAFTDPCPLAFQSERKELLRAFPEVTFIEIPRAPSAWSDDQRSWAGRAWSYVVCAGESAVAAADEVRRLARMTPRNSGDGRIRLDKYAAQQRLREAGLRHIHSVVLERDAVEEVACDSYPRVVKPVSSAGTDGVEIVDSDKALRRAARAAFARANALGVRNDRLVVQELLRGTEYVVDGAFDSHGRAQIACIGRYRKHVAVNSPVYEALSWVDRVEMSRADDLQRYLCDCLEALGVRVGCFHFEVFDTSDGWVMVEVGLRPHGGGHPGFTEALTGGVSQVSIELAASGHSAQNGARGDGPSESLAPRLARRGRVIFLHVPSPMKIIADPLSALDEMAGIQSASIAAKFGHVVEPPRSLFDTFKLGFVFCVADSEQRLDAIEAEARARFAACCEPATTATN